MAPEQHIERKPPPSQELRPHDSITRRLIYALALIPIVPSVSGICVVWAGPSLGAFFDEQRLFHLIFSVLFVVATIAIWRSVIIWTLGRKWLTAIVGLIPFAQVIYAQPMWTSGGCLGSIPDGMLRVGQHEVGIGLWIWLSVWVWWGWEKLNMRSNESTDAVKTIRMTPTARRLALSIGTFPFLFGVFLIATVGLDRLSGGRGGGPPPESFAISAAMAIAIWIAIWRNAVAWTPPAVRSTVVAALLCLGLPILTQFILWEIITQEFWWIVVVCLPVIGWGAWMAITISIWPVALSGYSGQSVSPRCPSCGYLLIGLKATRCPECGTEPTLDELWDATAGVV